LITVPLVGEVTMANVNGRLWGSLPVNVMITGVFAGVVTLCGLAVGGRFVTVTVINELFVPPIPSVIV